MKRIHTPRYSGLSRAAALLIAVICLATLQAAHAQTNGLVAAYSFDEGTGTIVNDTSGNGNTGTISGATWTTSGKYGNALVFNGSNSLIKVNDSASLDLTSGMTVEAWVYPTTTVSGWRDVVYKANDIYYLEAGSSSGGAPAGGGTFTNGNQNIYGVSALTVNTWTHLALTFDGSNLRLWVNGVQVSTTTQASPLTTSTQQLTIGGDSLRGQNFNGRIDEIRIYNRALSQAEIQTDMATPIGNVNDISVPKAATAEKTAADSSSLSVNAVSTSSASSVPGLVQHTVNTKDLQPFSISSTTTSLSNPSVAGNCLIVTAYYSGGGTPTISDDKGNSYTPIATSSAQSGQQLKMWAAPNVTAGTVKVTVSFSGGASWVSLMAAEFYDVATASPLDTSATAIGNSSSVAAGNMTVAAGDLVYQVAAYPSFPLTSWAPMSSPAFTPVSLNQVQGLAAQYWVATASSINPTFTVSPSNTWETVAVALKPATAGGPPSGMRVVKTESFYWTNVSSATLNFPTSGNLAVLSWISDQDLTKVSSSPGFNWASAVNNSASNAGYTRIYYSPNATSNNLSLDLQMSGLLAQGTAVMYDIAGAASSPLGATSVATGHQSSFGNLTAGSITPTSNGIVIPALAIESNSITGMAAPAGAVIDPQGNAQGTYGLDGWGHYFNSNTSPVTFTWTTNQQQFPGGVANWEVSVAAFNSTGGSDTTPPTAPTNLTAVASGSTGINLSWTASTDNVGVTGYLVERCQGSGCSNFTQIATTATTSYSDTGLTASTSYSYRVRATDAAGNLSGYSNIASATTASATGDTVAPTAPTNLTATPVGSSQINLGWTASTDNVGVTGYFVERCQGSGCSNFAQIANTAATSYSDTGLTASTSYSYRVRAMDAAGNLSSYSNTASATTRRGSKHQ